MTSLHDRIGVRYARYRVPDPRLQPAILDALGAPPSVVNVGAGAVTSTEGVTARDDTVAAKHEETSPWRARSHGGTCASSSPARSS